MPNVASILKSEIARVARKEVRGGTLHLQKAVSGYRSEIAALKRRAQALEQQLRRLSKGGKGKGNGKAAAAAEVDDGEGMQGFRFSAKGLASHRKRLGLSAHDCGVLLGASGQSIYKWEDGKARPRAKHLPAIAALRKLGKKQANAILESLRSK